MTRRYHLLLERECLGARWSVEFGDYDRKVVTQERIDRHDSWPFPRISNLKVVSVDADDSVSIKRTLEAINSFLEPES